MEVTTSRERRRQRARADLAAAALDIVSAEGDDAVSIERLTAEAGMARATVYAHYPDGRDGVLRAAYARAGRMLRERARAEAAGAVGWEERIVSYARTMIEFSSNPTLGRFYSLSGPHLLGFREERGEGSRGYFEVIAAELTAARDAGELVVDADPDALALLLTSSLRDAGIAVAHRPDATERYVAAVRTLIAGLRRDAGDRRKAGA